MRCDELMVRDLATVTWDDTCRDAALRMREADIGFLPVVTETRELRGVLTDRDLVLRLLADGRPPVTGVWEVMSREVVSVLPDDDVSEATRLMSEHGVRRLPVVDEDGRLAGVISLADISQVGDEIEVAETLRHVTERETRSQF